MGTVQRILDAATRIAGARGLDRTKLTDIARDAGVPLGLLRYHFRSREHLLIEAQRHTFRQIHARFEERFARGEGGVQTAMEALDALYQAVREMHPWTPFMVQTMAVACRDPALGERWSDFNAESLARVELGLMRSFADQLAQLVLPPDRFARAVRTGLYGLVVELAAARTEEELAQVDQTYEDVRALLLQVVLDQVPPAPTPLRAVR